METILIPMMDLAVLRTLTKHVGPDEELDTEWNARYWQLSRTLRAVHEPIRPADLAYLVLWANRPTPKPPLTFEDILKNHKIGPGRRVVAYFGGIWSIGHFVRKQGRKIVVVLDNSAPLEREVKPTDVRLATDAELHASAE